MRAWDKVNALKKKLNSVGTLLNDDSPIKKNLFQLPETE